MEQTNFSSVAPLLPKVHSGGMVIRITIKTIKFSDGTAIDASGTQIVVLVGPNNAGKSSTLNEIFTGAGNSDEVGPVLRDVLMEKHGSLDDLNAWLATNAKKVKIQYRPRQEYAWLGRACPEEDVEKSWNSRNIGALNNILCSVIDVEQRIQVPGPQEPINFFTEAPSHPMHVLFKRPDLEERVSEAFREAFKTEIILNRGGGKMLAFHVGARPPFEPGENALSPSYFERLRQMPFLHKQGHGMRSFAGCILHLFTSPAPILLVDEPEAFLHPPHAKLLGSMIGHYAETAGMTRQLFVATHSGDVLRGILDANPKALRVIRLTRDGSVNHVNELNTADIQSLWNDPVLRFSNVLDAIFHDGVVLCESDSDCRFYSAVLNAILEQRREIKPDVMFAAAGGKDRMPVIIKSLKRLGVKIRVVADFDVLRDEGTLSGIVEALGGNWAAVKPLSDRLQNDIRTKTPPLALNQLRDQIASALSDEKGPSVSDQAIEKIKQSLKATSPWHYVKLAGVNVLSSGQPSIQANELLQHLEALGLFPVTCGEIERFVPTVGSHGPKWVSQVLTKNLADDPDLEQARQFVLKVFDIGPHLGWRPPSKTPETSSKIEESKVSLPPRPTRGGALLKKIGIRK